ncbi:MAG: hypothetical protein V7L14_13130 [Nostoc sp.]|uniref:DUF6888 family protein n=1 Tax=Nostoc sp. TaxID=1180 RepID=UPI002FF66AB5
MSRHRFLTLGYRKEDNSIEEKLEPTPKQLQALYRRCVAVSNLMQPINVVRMDERSKRIFVLIGDTIEVEIFPNGEVFVK